MNPMATYAVILLTHPLEKPTWASLNSKSNTEKFSTMRSALELLGMMDTPRWMFHRSTYNTSNSGSGVHTHSHTMKYQTRGEGG